ncbi:MAG: bifunctional 5,10-methylenetetrahydrofolate dehydrogenase/5,10-methenyltetrahydrofolate cyclohydrolase [Patescibacteria group bacterium]
MATILDGRVLAERIRQKVKMMIADLPVKPGMTAILVGDDPASHLYVSLKEKACAEVGIHFEKLIYPAEVPQEELIKKINELNKRDDIHGILVQLPLPNQSADAVVAAINPNKDIDGFHPENLRRLEAGEPGLVPPVALGIMKLIDTGRHQNRTAAIIASEIFARPLKALLKEQQIEFVNNSQQADILIVAVGKPKSITADQVKPGAIVIDVGTTKTPDGLVGDVDFEAVTKVAGAITPVPGGVGPATVAMLTLNVVKAAILNKRR